MCKQSRQHRTVGPLQHAHYLDDDLKVCALTTSDDTDDDYFGFLQSTNDSSQVTVTENLKTSFVSTAKLWITLLIQSAYYMLFVFWQLMKRARILTVQASSLHTHKMSNAFVGILRTRFKLQLCLFLLYVTSSFILCVGLTFKGCRQRL